MLRFIVFAVLLPGLALAQSSTHIQAVERAQRAAYAVSDASNGCPAANQDVLGWPAALVRKCIYKGGALDGVVYLLDVKPQTIALWIETGCRTQMGDIASCFATVLKCGQTNSGMMFPITGNMLENMDHTPFKNYFFRNGMTVLMKGQRNGTTDNIDLARQDALALMPTSAIRGIPSGRTRLWRTLPSEFAAFDPASGAPASLATAQERQAWLDLAAREFRAALEKPENRLLNAWIKAHQTALRTGCPEG